MYDPPAIHAMVRIPIVLLRARLSLEGLVDVILLCKEVTLDLCIFEELKVSLCMVSVSHNSIAYHSLSTAAQATQLPSVCTNTSSMTFSRLCFQEKPTSQMSALLQMVDPLPPVALAHLVPH